ncbi:hypothetical protein ACFLZV_05305 [Candidatus Margulisiibacteriota bacterium]
MIIRYKVVSTILRDVVVFSKLSKRFSGGAGEAVISNIPQDPIEKNKYEEEYYSEEQIEKRMTFYFISSLCCLCGPLILPLLFGYGVFQGYKAILQNLCNLPAGRDRGVHPVTEKIEEGIYGLLLTGLFLFFMFMMIFGKSNQE